MTTESPDDPGHADLQRLLRWEDSGGTWTVAARRKLSSGEEVTLSLMTCDGGEEMDVLSSSEPDLLAHVFGDGRAEGGSAGVGPGTNAGPAAL